MKHKKKAALNFRDADRAYVVTGYLSFGLFLLYAIFAIPMHNYAAPNPSDWGFVVVLFLVAPLFLPAVGVLVALISGIGYWQAHQYGHSTACFMAILAFFLLWRGVWYVLYGRQAKWAVPTRTPLI